LQPCDVLFHNGGDVLARERALLTSIQSHPKMATLYLPVTLTGLRVLVTAEAAEVANMALYLASPFGASITGQAISVDGDVQMMQ
jgi:enoyl-[acyl-carrier-protein] reductase (NADH)